jgi:hypothetical protein
MVESKKAGNSAIGINLRDIKHYEQFPEYYKQNRLTTVKKKIEHLMKATGVNAIRGDGVGRQKETLALLEESTILGYWRFLGDGR